MTVMMTTTFGASAPAVRRRGLGSLTCWMTLAAFFQVTPAHPARAQPSPTHQFLPHAKTHIANAFAVRGDGAELAYITTDGVESSVLHIVDLVAQAQPREIAVPGRVESLLWLGPGRLLVISRPRAGGCVGGTPFTGSGPEGSSVGPADHIAAGSFEGQPVIIAYSRAIGTTGEHELAAFDTVSQQPLARRKLRLDERRRLEVNGEQVRLLWWGDDFAFAAVRHPGRYDRARDLRLPDRFGRVDLLSNTLIDDAPIVPAGFARLASLHRLHPGRSLFVHVDPDKKQLLLIDGPHARVLEPARPLGKYDPSKTSTHSIGPDEVLVSPTVDPLNHEAVARKQRDLHEIELYSVNRATGAMDLRLTLRGESRPALWHVGGNRLALLRQHRGFSRGGVMLQVYKPPGVDGERPR